MRLRGTAVTDLAPLQRRLGLLQVLRVALAAITTFSAFLLPVPIDSQVGLRLVVLSLAYAAGTGAVELTRRHLSLRNPAVVGVLVLFDGAYLALVMALTGGPQSVLSFLVLVHVIAVTLLLSFRSGLKVSLWHALLVFGSSWLQRAGLVDEGPGVTADQAAVVGVLALLVVAVATAWFSSLNERELRRGKAELGALATMAQRMAGTSQPLELVSALLRGVDDAFGFGRAAVVVADRSGGGASVFVLDPDGNVGKVASGPLDPADAENPQSTPAALVRSLDAGRVPLLARALPGAVNVVIVPLVVEGRDVGTLAVERGGPLGTRVPGDTVNLLGQFAAHAALALNSAALRAEVERLADTDPLTGLPNRRVFQDALARELAVATRRGEPCGLIVLDIDHFKAVNDNHGHQAGDEVLRQVGRALAVAARETDVPARYGGEEFAVVVPGCAAGEAAEVAERLRAAIAASPGPVPVTVSAGVAAFPFDAADASSLVGAADAALYRAKRNGRDRSARFRRARPVHLGRQARLARRAHADRQLAGSIPS